MIDTISLKIKIKKETPKDLLEGDLFKYGKQTDWKYAREIIFLNSDNSNIEEDFGKIMIIGNGLSSLTLEPDLEIIIKPQLIF